MRRNRSKEERGQAHTLESVVGAVLLLTAIAFALQVTIVTPLSASTSSQHIEGQQRSVAQGVLASAAEEGALQEAVLYWNNTGSSFHNTSTRGFYASGPPDIQFGNMLSRAFDEEGIAYNVYFTYQSSSSSVNRRPFILQGTPTDNAVSTTRTIALRNDDRLVDKDGSLDDTTVNETDSFYINNAPSGAASGLSHGVYNLVRIEVVAWRI